MTFVRELRRLARRPGFRWLLLVRLFAQSSDGMFQVALAGTILFSPEKNADPRAIAIAFSVVLLPYSCLGPFAGVLIDRWSRRGILALAQVVRAALVLTVSALMASGQNGFAFYATVLAVFSVNRFVLAAIPAAMPHVVPTDELVGANAIVPTFGTMCFTLGIGLGSLVRLVSSDAVVALATAGGALTAAWTATRLPFVGPDRDARPLPLGAAIADVGRGLVTAARVMPHRARVLLLLVAAKRFAIGLLLISTALLFRNHFAARGDTAVGFGAVAAATAIGFLVAALTAPGIAPRVGLVRYAVICLAIAGAVCLAPGILLTQWSVAVVGFVTAAMTQAPKICIDSLLQEVVPDRYLGRTFAIYDVMFNGATVAAASLAAWLLPPSGHSHMLMVVIAAWFALSAMGLALAWRRAEHHDTARGGRDGAGASG